MSRILQTQNQFIIRFPQNVAEQLNKFFDNQEQQDNNIQPKIEIELDQNRKEVNNRIALKIATVMQLPTTLSTFKTIDRINFFKSNDISEIIIVHDLQQDLQNIRQDEAQPIYDKHTGKIINYKKQSGLTLPTKYIKQNNFHYESNIDKIKLENVDKQMEEIRISNIQNKQFDNNSSQNDSIRRKKI